MPDDLGYGMKWKAVVYIPALTSISIGVAQFAVFAAIVEGQAYLRNISLESLSKDD